MDVAENLLHCHSRHAVTVVWVCWVPTAIRNRNKNWMMMNQTNNVLLLLPVPKSPSRHQIKRTPPRQVMLILPRHKPSHHQS